MISDVPSDERSSEHGEQKKLRVRKKTTINACEYA